MSAGSRDADAGPEAAGLESRLRLLPKADLHLHLLGAMRPRTILDLAARPGGPTLDRARLAVERGFSFPDLPGFIAFFLGLFELVLDAATFERVAYEVLEDAARAGTRYAELRVTPTSHLSRGADEEGMFRGLAAGRREAERSCGILSRVIVDFPRTLPPSVAEEALHVALRRKPDGVTGFDVAGDEKAVQADERFAPIFREGRRRGLHLTAHAGEAAGPESVRDALDRYGVRRIGHGTRAIEDEALVGRLAEERIPLEVCVSSNEALSCVASVREHPVKRLLDAGVPCIPCTDDPTLFATDLAREYRRWHEEAGVSLAELREMAALGLESAFLEEGPSGEEARERLLADAAEARRQA